jgi:hypothetical protein
MPKGPRGEKRPADAIGRAVMVARIVTGEVEDDREDRKIGGGQTRQQGRESASGSAHQTTPHGDC